MPRQDGAHVLARDTPYLLRRPFTDSRQLRLRHAPSTLCIATKLTRATNSYQNGSGITPEPSFFGPVCLVAVQGTWQSPTLGNGGGETSSGAGVSRNQPRRPFTYPG